MSEEVVTEPVVDPALTPPPAEPPADPPAPEPEQHPVPRMIPVETFQREVFNLREKARGTEAALDEHRRQLRDAHELLTRLQQKPGEPATPLPPRPAADPDMVPRSEVQRLAAEQNFQRDASHVIQTGLKTYGQSWNESVGLLQSFGLDNVDFVQSIMDVAGLDRTHEVVRTLTQEPERLEAMRNMSPARRISEITRISIAMNAPKPVEPTPPAPPPARTVSRAPAPPPPVEPSASKPVDWRSDKASDEDFSRGWEENAAKRRARR